MRLVVLFLSLFVLGGCSTATVAVVPAPISSPVETIARDGVEEAAVSAVTDYFDVSTRIAGDGGVNPERIADVVTSDWLPNEIAGFDALHAMGTVQVGAPIITRIEATAVRGIAAVSEVVVHACTVLDGVSIVSDDITDDVVPNGVALVTVYVVPENGVLKVDGVEPWEDTSWCAES